MSQIVEDMAEAALRDPALRKELTEEARLDEFEQRIFNLNKRVAAMRPKVNPKVRRAVQVGIVMDAMDARTHLTMPAEEDS